MSLIVGVDDFGKIIEKKLGFIDKSLFIKEIFDNEQIDVPVIVRPRRFGKTLNMSMLRHFLAAEVNGLKTQGIFDNLKIAQQGDDYMQHQGKYPVIFISFKTIKASHFDKVYPALANLISQTYSNHYELLSSDALHPHEKIVFDDILNQRANTENLMASLSNLTKYLHRHYGIKPWLLIDEYDTPIQAGYLNNYYREIIEVMRGLLGAALKGNEHIHRAVVTGILRIAKEDLFSGLNNVKVYSVLDTQYAECFGFTETEVDGALKENNLAHLSADIKAWYNGYHIGKSQIYNPWSIANCIDEKGELEPYWIHTSDNALIKQTMARANTMIKMQFEAILEGKAVEVLVHQNITFADLNSSGDKLWTLLLFAGYLTSTRTEIAGLERKCLLTPPNKEVALLYPHIITAWFADSLTMGVYHALLKYLTEGDLPAFLKILKKYLRESASYFDVKGEEPEKFYHGFVMGLIVSLSDTHFVQSNKESGEGRYDVLLIPKDPLKLGLILEFKVSESDTVLQKTAEQALAQITERGYTTELQQRGIHHILKVGLAFWGKDVALASN